jgi:bacillopeptidase F (M6 metalloprotease family)
VGSSAVVYWKLAVRDLFGDSAIDSGSCTAPAPPILLSEDFEGSYAGWTLTGDWQAGTPSYTGPSAAYQGTRCAGTVINGYYHDNTTSQLTSPAVTIPAAVAQATLSYYEWYSTESCCDYLTVYISTNGGSSWTTLQPGRSGNNATWTRQAVDLSSYIGTTIRLRFTFGTDGSVVNAGWYLDSLSIWP